MSSPTTPAPAAGVIPAEPKWLVARADEPDAPLFQITLGAIDGELPEQWIDIHEEFVRLVGKEADESEADIAARRQRLQARCDESENYVFATYLKWDCAMEIQCAPTTVKELEQWQKGEAPREALTLLRLEELGADLPIVGLLLLRWGWAGSVVFEFLNVWADLGNRMNCQPAVGLVRAGLDLARRLGRDWAWVETGPVSEAKFWSLLLPHKVQEIRHSSVDEAMSKVTHMLGERNLAITVLEGVALILLPAAADRIGSAAGKIQTRERLGGLLKFYHREAA